MNTQRRFSVIQCDYEESAVRVLGEHQPSIQQAGRITAAGVRHFAKMVRAAFDGQSKAKITRHANPVMALSGTNVSVWC